MTIKTSLVNAVASVSSISKSAIIDQIQIETTIYIYYKLINNIPRYILIKYTPDAISSEP